MSTRAAVIRAVVILIFLFSFFSISAQDSDWIVAASPFTLETDIESLSPQMQKTAAALQYDLPMLILSRLSDSLERTLLPDEVYRRELYELQSKMQNLLSEYAAALKARDQQLFTAVAEKNLSVKIAENEKKIETAANKISDNFAAQETLKKKYENQRITAVSANKRERVVLYKDSSNNLFTYDSQKVSKEDLESLINKEKIRGLISGSIKIAGEYLLVVSSLRTYPIESISPQYEIMIHLTETDFAASEISSHVMALISNTLPSLVRFALYPEEDAQQASVFVSDVFLKGSSSSTLLLRGIYSIRIECPGYETVSFAYPILQNTEYNFTVNLKKQSLFPVVVSNTYETPGTMFLNAVSYGTLPASITVNGKQYLGEFASEQGWSNFFVYNSKFAQDQQSLNLTYANKDITKLIDKSRKRLYISYAAVVCALPVYFYSDAVYKKMLSAQTLNIPVSGSLSSWQAASSISLGAVAVLGVNMGIQLALYLADANKILPKEQLKEKGN